MSTESEQESTAVWRPEANATHVAVPSPCPFGVGSVIMGRYRLVRRLGSGASANVWAAYDEHLGRDVAIKTLLRVADEDDVAYARLRREAQALARIDHPRITRVLDLIEVGGEEGAGMPVLVTELLSGEDLGVRLRRGAMDLDQALAVCAELADALDAAHRAGVVHRDLKPANVMLTPAGAMLLDFGIARTDGNSDLTGACAIGTPACMAPEQWLGRKIDPATDVYALGCLLYWCLSGEAPFAERVLPALAMAHLQSDPPALPERGQRPEIDALYRACLAKDPADRPSAAEVTRVLTVAAWSEQTVPAAARGHGVRRSLRAGPMVAGSRAAVLTATGCLLLVAGAIAVPLMANSADYSAPRPDPTSTSAPATSKASNASKPAAAASPSSRGGGGAVPASATPSSAGPDSPVPPVNGPKPIHIPPGHQKKH